MEMTFSKGDRVVLTDNRSQTFVGIVKNLNRDLKRLMLSNVVQLPGKIDVEGYRHFDWNEIAKVKKCEEDLDEIKLGSDGGSSDIQIKEAKDIITTTSTITKLCLSESRFNEIEKLQKEYRYIRDFGTNFHSAIGLLKGCVRVGLYGADVSKGRCGRASVLAVATPTNIFVFDIGTLGDELFERGLKDVLESPEVVKVTHDSRLLSDCLHHKHLVNLENIRDVEAEDVMVVLQERNTIRKHNRSFEYLVGVYLGLELKCIEDGDWKQRPLPENLLQGLVTTVSFLLPLQEALEEKYLQRLIAASALYNTHIRSLDMCEFLLADPGKVPRKDIMQIVLPQMHVRGEAKPTQPQV